MTLESGNGARRRDNTLRLLRQRGRCTEGQLVPEESPVTASPPPVESLRQLPLHRLHERAGARMVPFAGFAMPIHYPLGILGEHKHTRAAAGLFDVSHMGQIVLRSRSGDPEAAARALETLTPANVLGLPPGRQRYALLTNAAGGIGDDLMIAHLDTFHHLVVNAACTAKDLAYLQAALEATCRVELTTDRALLALQGPAAAGVLAALAPAVESMRFMDARSIVLGGVECVVTRSGYTGEDGFELSVPAAAAAALAERLLAHDEVRLVGLGARDSLRLEAGLCLYGHDLTDDTTPVEAALEWAIAPVRRRGGAREGGFPGADVILAQQAGGAHRRRVGLRAAGRPVREGAVLYADATSSVPIGAVTSGTFGPSVAGPVAMGYVPPSAATPGTGLFAQMREQRTPVTVSSLPFVQSRYHR